MKRADFSVKKADLTKLSTYPEDCEYFDTSITKELLNTLLVNIMCDYASAVYPSSRKFFYSENGKLYEKVLACNNQAYTSEEAILNFLTFQNKLSIINKKVELLEFKRVEDGEYLILFVIENEI
jgi:hypothetical protein